MNIINEDTFVMYYDITVVRKDAASLFYLNLLSNTVSLVSSLRFLCSGHCLEQLLIKLLRFSNYKSNLDCACAVVYFTDSPSSFSVYSFVRICEVSD